MKCPVCSSYFSQEIDLRSDQFTEELLKCDMCGSEWSIQHGLIDVVKDSLSGSFLSAETEAVEGYDSRLSST